MDDELTLNELANLISQSFGEERTHNDAQFRQVNQRLDTHDLQFERMHTRLDDHGKQLEHHGKQLKQINVHLAKHDKQFEQINGHLGNHNKQLEQINTHLVKHDQQFIDMNSKIDDLREEVRSIRAALDKVVTRSEFELIEKRLARVERRLGLDKLSG